MNPEQMERSIVKGWLTAVALTGVIVFALANLVHLVRATS